MRVSNSFRSTDWYQLVLLINPNDLVRIEHRDVVISIGNANSAKRWMALKRTRQHGSP